LVDSDPSGRQNTISLGLFIGHLVVVAAARGLSAAVEYRCISLLDSGETHLTFRSAGTVTDHQKALARAVQARRTDRGAYRPNLAQPDIAELRPAEVPDGTAVTFITDGEQKATVGRLVQQSMDVALRLPAMRRELADLVHFSDEPSWDRGMFLDSMIADPNSIRRASSTTLTASKWLLSELDAAAEGTTMRQHYTTAPLIVVISTDHDGPRAWLDAGRTASTILLQAAAHGLRHCIAAGPVEVPPLVPQLRALLSHRGRPQLVARLGVPISSAESPKSPRVSFVGI
jgi:hypothetical protein